VPRNLFLMELGIETLIGVVTIELDGVTAEAYAEAQAMLDKALSNPRTKNRDAIRNAFRYLVGACPNANASDLWHHIVYRQYCKILPKHRPLDPGQSWKRASGDALEATLEQLYTPILSPHGITIKMLVDREEKKRTLASMGISGLVGDSKLDVVLAAKVPTKKSPLFADEWQIFGGIHVKASLAERVSDDVPASRAMMERGYFSPLWTLDVKSFPPGGFGSNQSTFINRGELGSLLQPSDKRKYIEIHGDFDNCYTANSRSVPSPILTPTASGKRIYGIQLSVQPDKFANDVIERANAWRLQHQS
jgi:hypothetical protein